MHIQEIKITIENEGNKGKRIYRKHLNKEGGLSYTFEEMVLDVYYKKKKRWVKGDFVYDSLFTVIFALPFWDVIFDDSILYVF